MTDPSAPEHLYLRATFGLLVSRDRGATWDWLCEEGMGYQNLEPPMAILPGGAILLAVPQGVSRGEPSGCDFRLADGIDQSVVDIASVPSEPESAVAVSLSGAVSQLWLSTDEGRSFGTVGAPLDGFIAATVDVAAQDPEVIYVSGLDGTQGTLLRSHDGGKSFDKFPVPNTSTGRRPYIAAVSATDEDTVYVRLIGVQGELQVTHDGGKSFETVLQTTIPVQAFALSPDGKTVLASNDFDGTFRASTSSYAFEQVACGGHSCLSWSDAGLFGCGDDIVDGYIVGRSDDRGASFESVLTLPCVRGPLECDAATTIGAACPSAWAGVSEQLGVSQCAEREAPPPYTGCFADSGGASGAGGGQAGASGTPAGAMGIAGAGPSAVPSPSAAGCGCRSAARGISADGWCPGFAGAWLLHRRRSRRRRARGS